MGIYSIILAIVAGICLGFGLLFLFIGLRRKDNKRLNLIFALFALSYGGAVLTGIGRYTAGSLEKYLAIARWDGLFVVLAFVSLIWYVAFYTEVRPRILLIPLTAGYIAAGLANTFRANLIYEEILGLGEFVLPWGEGLVYVEASESVWALLFLVVQLATIVFIVFACFRQFRRGERQAALVLGAGMAWLIITIIVDSLADAGIVLFYIGDFGFLGVAMAISLQMVNSVIKTEEELAEHRQNLERLVEARTAELQAGNEQLLQEVDRRARIERSLRESVEELDLLHTTARILANVADPQAALQEVSQFIAQHFDARYAHVIISDPLKSRMLLLLGYEDGIGPTGLTPLTYPLDETPLQREVFDLSKALILDKIPTLSFEPEVRSFLEQRGVQSLLVVPLVVRGTTIGLLTVASDQAGRTFTPRELNLAKTLAGDIAAAVENNRLLEQTKELAAAEERNRLARDLHDAVTQTIYSAALVAEALPTVWERNPTEGKRNLTKLRQFVRGALAEMRALLFELRPAALEGADLENLLRQSGDTLTGRTRIPVEVEVEGPNDLPADVKIAFYRVVQEALNNVAKHASAEWVKIVLQSMVNRAILSITDNGRGFDPGVVPAERMGLNIMRERADSIGAELDINSKIGQGTQLTVTWPRRS